MVWLILWEPVSIRDAELPADRRLPPPPMLEMPLVLVLGAPPPAPIGVGPALRYGRRRGARCTARTRSTASRYSLKDLNSRCDARCALCCSAARVAALLSRSSPRILLSSWPLRRISCVSRLRVCRPSSSVRTCSRSASSLLCVTESKSCFSSSLLSSSRGGEAA